MYSKSDVLDTTSYIDLIQYKPNVATYRSDAAKPLPGGGARTIAIATRCKSG